MTRPLLAMLIVEKTGFGLAMRASRESAGSCCCYYYYYYCDDYYFPVVIGGEEGPNLILARGGRLYGCSGGVGGERMRMMRSCMMMMMNEIPDDNGHEVANGDDYCGHGWMLVVEEEANLSMSYLYWKLVAGENVRHGLYVHVYDCREHGGHVHVHARVRHPVVVVIVAYPHVHAHVHAWSRPHAHGSVNAGMRAFENVSKYPRIRKVHHDASPSPPRSGNCHAVVGQREEEACFCPCLPLEEEGLYLANFGMEL